MTAPLAPASRSGLSRTESNALLALLGTLGLFLLFYGVGELERGLAPGQHRTTRFVREATETTTRLLAVAHTLVATLFLLTSAKVRSPAGAGTFAALGALSVAACLGFAALGGREGGVAMGLFALYFLLHDLRDEAWFYGVNGDAPPNEARRRGASLAVFVLGVMLATFAAGLGLGLPRLTRSLGLLGAAPALRVSLAVAGATLALLVAHLALRRFSGGPVRGAPAQARRHRPLVVVMLGVYAVFFASIALTGRFYALVATHVVIWYVFTLRRLADATPAAAPRPWTLRWMRTTVVGFNALHLGLLVLLAGAAAVHAFAFGNDRSATWLQVTVSRDAFPYWTLVHVTLSWFPRR